MPVKKPALKNTIRKKGNTISTDVNFSFATNAHTQPPCEKVFDLTQR